MLNNKVRNANSQPIKLVNKLIPVVILVVILKILFNTFILFSFNQVYYTVYKNNYQENFIYLKEKKILEQALGFFCYNAVSNSKVYPSLMALSIIIGKLLAFAIDTLCINIIAPLWRLFNTILHVFSTLICLFTSQS